MKPQLTYVSLFSGIEACSVAMSRIAEIDWKPIFFSEIEDFPCRVLKYHFPDVPNLGDVTKIRVEERTNPETNTKEKVITNGHTSIPFPGTGIDILAGGPPCQSVSVAGRRHGMQKGSGTRSSLFWEFARLVEELRPRVVVYENVPGVLSSRGGRDWYALQCAMAELGLCCAYRTLDVQYTRVDCSFPRGIPQRRRRVWLVGVRTERHLGSDRPVPVQILLEPTRMLGDRPPKRIPGQAASFPAGYGPEGADRSVGFSCGNGQLNSTKPDDAAKTLDTMHDAQIVCIVKEGYNIGKAGQGSLNISEDNDAQTIRADTHPSAVAIATYENHAQDARVKEIEVSDTRSGKDGTGGNNVPLVVFSKASHARNKDGYGERDEEGDVAQTRNTFDQGETRAQELVIGTLGQKVAPAVAKTLSAEGFDGMPEIHKGNGMPVVAIDGNGSRPSHFGDGYSTEGVGYTLNHVEQHAVAVRTANTHANGHGVAEEATHTLDRASGQAVAVFCDRRNQTGADEVQPALQSTVSDGGSTVAVGCDMYNMATTGDVWRTIASAASDCNHMPTIALNHIVRRLTVVECSRLQGFPDWWVRIPVDKWRKIDEDERDYLAGLGPWYRSHIRETGKPGVWETDLSSDSPAYKALGNSWATNCAEWILRRIVAAFRLDMIS